jgi:hypothetical protein
LIADTVGRHSVLFCVNILNSNLILSFEIYLNIYNKYERTNTILKALNEMTLRRYYSFRKSKVSVVKLRIISIFKMSIFYHLDILKRADLITFEKK